MGTGSRGICLLNDLKRKLTQQRFSSMKDRQRTEAQTTTVAADPSSSNVQGSTSMTPSESTSQSSSRNDSASSTAPDPQLDSEASAIPKTISNFVYQQGELVTEDDTVNEPLFGINILPLAASSRRGPVQTTRLPCSN